MKQALKALIHEMEYVLSCINADKVPFDGDDFHEALRLGKEALAQPEQDKERCVGCEACIDTACGRDECPKGWPKAAQPERHELQKDGKHPAPCARFCEANAFQIEIRRLKAQLAQPKEPEKEPVAIMREMLEVQGQHGNWNYDPYMHGLYNGMECMVALAEKREPQFCDAPETWLAKYEIKRNNFNSTEPLTEATPPQRKPEQEPACCNGNCPNTKDCEQAMQCLYTTPPQRTWVGLTEEEIEACFHYVDEAGIGLFDFAEAIEAKLKEKNT